MHRHRRIFAATVIIIFAAQCMCFAAGSASAFRAYRSNQNTMPASGATGFMPFKRAQLTLPAGGLTGSTALYKVSIGTAFKTTTVPKAETLTMYKPDTNRVTNVAYKELVSAMNKANGYAVTHNESLVKVEISKCSSNGDQAKGCGK